MCMYYIYMYIYICIYIHAHAHTHIHTATDMEYVMIIRIIRYDSQKNKTYLLKAFNLIFFIIYKLQTFYLQFHN